MPILPFSNQYGNEFSIDTCLKRAPNPSSWPLSTPQATRMLFVSGLMNFSQTASSLFLDLQVRGSAKHGHPTASSHKWMGTPNGSPANIDGIGPRGYKEHQICQRLLKIPQLPRLRLSSGLRVRPSNYLDRPSVVMDLMAHGCAHSVHLLLVRLSAAHQYLNHARAS